MVDKTAASSGAAFLLGKYLCNISTGCISIQTNCMMQISIPKPCHEDWRAMTPNEYGRHCNICCKTVVDFTTMNDDEVKSFFINRNSKEGVCGRFKSEQLHRIKVELPYNIYKITMPLWKRFLTACLLAFSSMLFSCDAVVDNNTIGDIVLPVVTIDTSAKDPTLPLPVEQSVSIGDSTAIFTAPEIKGDIDIEVINTHMMGFTATLPAGPVDEPITPDDAIGVVEPDTLGVMTGEIDIDTGNIPAIDSAKAKKAAPECGNEFINL